MSENTQVILMVTFINGLIYTLFQQWKLRRSTRNEGDNGSGPAK